MAGQSMRNKPVGMTEAELKAPLLVMHFPKREKKNKQSIICALNHAMYTHDLYAGTQRPEMALKLW